MYLAPRYILFACCLWLGLGHAQETVRRFQLERITTEQGLPQGMVQDILQDRRGYLWATTKDGLARSDGYGFTIFKHDPADSTSIAGDHSNLLYEDRSGAIWVAVSGVGLDRYDPRTGSFTHVHNAPDLPKTAYDALTRIREDREGRIWCLSSYRELSVVVPDASGRPILRAAAKVLPALELPAGICAFEFVEDILWVVTNDRLAAIPLSGTTKPAMPVRELPLPTLSAIGELEPHQLLLRPDESELVLGLPGAFLRIAAATGEVLESLPVPAVPRLMEMQLVDDDGRLWYRCDDGVVRRLHLRTGALERLDLSADDKDVYVHMQTVFFSLQDAQGNFWGGTKGFGILKLGRNSARFSARPAEPIVGYYVDPYVLNGHLQFAMTRHRLGLRALPSPPELERSGFGTPAGERNWEGAATDPQGRTWGLLTRGDLEPRVLCHVDRDGHLHRTALLDPADVPNRVLHGRGDEIWVTTATAGGPSNVRNGLVRIDTRRMAVTGRYEFPVAFLLSKYWPISQWSIAPDGVIWMATIEGLLKLDPADGSWQVYRHDPTDERSLPHDLLFCLCPDPQEPERYLWVGTEGKGMARFDMRTGHCERYTVKDGLPNEVVYGILSDAGGDLWVSTNTGLCRFRPGEGAIRTYTQADGIAGDEFNRYGSLVLPDGRLFFDGMEGGTAFLPADLKEDERPAPTRLTGVRLATRTLPIHALGALGDASGPVITIPYDETLLTVQYALMDHTAPARNTFRYRLDGYTPGWIDAGDRHEATFTNLDPGTYTFRVEGTNNDGARDPVGASLTITVTPPWWGTWWFRTLSVLVVLALLYAFYRFRLAQQLQLARTRDRIARDLHDEVGSTLSSVALNSEVALRSGASLPEVQRETLQLISASTSEMMERMNDIVWAVNSDNDDLLHVVQRMKAFAAQLTEAAGMRLDFHFDERLAERPLSMLQRKNLYLIFKEAVNNAVKHSRGSQVSVHLGREQGVYVLQVTDDGVGRQEQHAKPKSFSGGGNGLVNMRSRAEELHGALEVAYGPGGGTQVTLRFRP